MKYIVWDLISAYDGYNTTDCDTWEEARKKVEELCSYSKKATAAYKKWLEGKISKIQIPDVEIFVTSEPLNRGI